ncbi:MAG: hypothetical protein FIA94_04605 [Nitrospirae bacterium]|nr:hypothetical protein [Nitrospirota bacterium]
MKNSLLFALFILIVVGFLFSISGKKYPQMPADTSHLGVTDTAVCMGCHEAGKLYPRKATHPPKFECLKCHKQKRKKT